MKRYSTLTLALSACFAATASAGISYDVGGLAGTGVTGNVNFSYSFTDSTSAQLTVAITNTTDASLGGFISGWAMNVPSGGTATITSIGGDVDDGFKQATTLLTAPPNQVGWYARLDPGEISAPAGGGNFDFGVLNQDNPMSFVTGGTANPRAPRIGIGEMTTFTLDVLGTGLDTLTASSFLAALSSEGYNFGLRFQGLLGGGSDLAVPLNTTTTIAPTPSAAVLGLVGLAGAGIGRRKRRNRPV